MAASELQAMNCPTCNRPGWKREKAEAAFPKPVRRNKKVTRWRKGLDGKAHEFLHGEEAHRERRLEIYRSCGGMAIVSVHSGEVIDLKAATCKLCPVPHFVCWADGHWIHLEKRHCDCLNCGTFGCKAAHTRLHHGGREFL